jgi:CRP-like cAMP-binding protein
MAAPTTNFRNQLLTSLSRRDLALVAPKLEHRTMALRHRIEEANLPIRRVYFIESGFASTVADGGGGRDVEVGLTGREGATGTAILLGSDRSPHATYTQLAGAAYCLGATDFRALTAGNVRFRDLMLKFAHVLLVQTAQTALSNGRAKIEERLARWILMAQDRINGDGVPLTHEFLSIMLGVRRAGVTVALNALGSRGLVASRRGNVIVIDRDGLVKAAGRSYGVPEKEYRRLLGIKPPAGRT